MKIEIDFERMKEVFGEEMEEIVNENMSIIEKNADIMKEFKYDDIEGLFEVCPDLFLYFPKDFRRKMEEIKKDLGENYVEKVENDFGLLEKYI